MAVVVSIRTCLFLPSSRTPVSSYGFGISMAPVHIGGRFDRSSLLLPHKKPPISYRFRGYAPSCRLPAPLHYPMGSFRSSNLSPYPFAQSISFLFHRVRWVPFPPPPAKKARNPGIFHLSCELLSSVPLSGLTYCCVSHIHSFTKSF